MDNNFDLDIWLLEQEYLKAQTITNMVILEIIR